MKYAVVFEHTDPNWATYVPDLAGCIATGKTRAQVERRIRDAINLHLEALRASGDEVPSPTASVGVVEAI